MFSRHQLRQQRRLAVAGIAVEAELDLAVPPRRQAGAEFDRVALRAALSGRRSNTASPLCSISSSPRSIS